MFDISKNKMWLLLLPIALIIAGVVGYFANGGFMQDIDFAGGTSMHIAIEKPVTSEDRVQIKTLFEDATGASATVQTTGQNSNEIIIKSTELNQEQRDAGFGAIKEAYSLTSEGPLGVDNQNASYGNEMKLRTLLYSLIAALLMLIYISIRFELRSAIMAVVALMINTLIMLSVYAIFRIPLSTSFIAAVLTIMGYSINDTIIVFDRIRENLKITKKESVTSVVEKSIWQTFGRTINTVATTLITIVILYIIGVPDIRDFAFPIIVGILSGAYTSIFVASPWWASWKENTVKSKKSR